MTFLVSLHCLIYSNNSKLESTHKSNLLISSQNRITSHTKTANHFSSHYIALNIFRIKSMSWKVHSFRYNVVGRSFATSHDKTQNIRWWNKFSEWLWFMYRRNALAHTALSFLCPNRCPDRLYETMSKNNKTYFERIAAFTFSTESKIVHKIRIFMAKQNMCSQLLGASTIRKCFSSIFVNE